jgi:hypothetical protein
MRFVIRIIRVSRISRRMFKKPVQRGRSERKGEAYVIWYVEPLSDARTKLAGFFNVLLADEVGVQPTEGLNGECLDLVVNNRAASLA